MRRAAGVLTRIEQSKGRRRAPSGNIGSAAAGGLPLPFLPPPPSAQDVKRNRQSRNFDEELQDTKLGFDDDAFGDFV